MVVRKLVARLGWPLMAAMAVVAVAGCHRDKGDGDFEPLTEQKIYVSDRYFDVAAPGPKEAIVIGYGGKMLHTTDAGFTWDMVETGTDKALYSIDFAAGNQVGWIVGEEGLILRTTDGGKTWSDQKTEIWLDGECADPDERSFRELNEDPCHLAYLFAVSVVDANTAHVIGDKSIYARTRDGGRTWESRTIKVDTSGISDDLLLAVEDPVLYDVQFLDADNGYIVGEFGKIFHTRDGGDTWKEQQESVMDDSVLDILDLPTFFDVEFIDEKRGIVCGLDGRIAVTTDGGNDWNFVPNNVADYIDPFYSATILSDGTQWVVGASGQVVIAKDGQPFVKGSFGSAVNNWLRRVRFYDQNTGWVVGGFGLIMVTEDGGETWFRRFG